MIIFNNRYKFRDFGLLLLRIGIGIMLVFHGLPKLMGGAAQWDELGSAVSHFGIYEHHEIYGYIIAFTEFGGGILLLFGLFHRIICFLLILIMALAAANYFMAGAGLKGAHHAVEGGVLFLSLLFIGPGRYALDQLLFES